MVKVIGSGSSRGRDLVDQCEGPSRGCARRLDGVQIIEKPESVTLFFLQAKRFGFANDGGSFFGKQYGGSIGMRNPNPLTSPTA